MATTLMVKDGKTTAECTKAMLAIKDAIEVLEGRWKLPIILSLTFGKKRFRQISKDIDGITDKMLSKELKYLETNKLIQRDVYDTFPPTVEYSITEHGKALEKVIEELFRWGRQHRRKIMGK
jgi:DNA-binding HxlR family transcriptional regulator